MPRLSKGHSLGKRLSYRLALLTFCGLAIVSIVVYVATAIQLDDRQKSQLFQYERLVRHLSSEHSQPEQAPLFNHKLDDLFGDRTDISLALTDTRGNMIYASRSAVAGAKRSHRFSLNTAASENVLTTAVLSVATQRDDQLLQQLAATLLVVALGSASVVSAFSFFLVKRGLAPVSHLVSQMQSIPGRRLHSQLDGSSQPVELQPLIEQFNALLLRLDQAYEQQKGFSADVAHELRTPLANMTASSELALLGGATDPSLRDTLESNLEELDRMTTIVGDMLFLAQADRGEEARRVHSDSLLNELRDVLVYYEATLEEAGLTVSAVGDVAGEYDVSLLKRAISNLIENAMRHAAAGTVVLLRLSGNDTSSTIEVENTGNAISAAKLERIFQRFYRGDAPNGATGQRNHGLGLSIVAAIARMHGGTPIARSSGTVTAIGLRVPNQRHDAENSENSSRPGHASTR
ncbi:heavy metal sensor histidine kinase [Pigmentiphaga kullae]|uniref:Sensor protein n=1 Tax=Pigmentiphaga kullae TaxID=151784 RepID=A0A4Q7NN60_9BURK|nr:heavy metal sensor histidine kinase [Pigmentiphaga kullae]RZS86583.1 two-component system heavy metal sensor histidine kinase CusS [Pigmentiphaga kullae]